MTVSWVLLLAFLIGVVCGLRSLTAPALVCWGAYQGWLNLAGSPVAFLANLVSLIVFVLLAVGELIADKTSRIPRRTTLFPLIARIVLGGLCGTAFAVAGGASTGLGFVLGGVGGLTGAYAGYYARRAATDEGRLPDLPIAFLEDLIAIGGGFFLVSRF
jgi:uncharacterized membrane protein